ncbi:hypothetical protein [Streptomyces mirabilis]|uniref:hypothetical protein n=1 Tax=Streptomyces mirabilis TaxID=68239 RepID=UPI003F4D1E98
MSGFAQLPVGYFSPRPRGQGLSRAQGNSRDVAHEQARALLDDHTAMGGPGMGWDLHEYRHSTLTHLGEQGSLMLMSASSS